MELQNFHNLFIAEIKRRLLGECQERTLMCLDLLTEQEIWYRPNEHSNSVGNLILHLCGNVSQWLFSTLGGEKDIRQRQEEFEHDSVIPTGELKKRVVHLFERASEVIEGVTPGDLMQSYRVQGFDESGVAILIHITEHFSYHVGQITYYVKSIKDIDVGYYEGEDLNQTT